MKCKIDWCNDPSRTRGLCNMHYRRLGNGTPMNQPKALVNKGRTCRVEGCNEPAKSLLLCAYHYQRDYYGLPTNYVDELNA